MARRRTELVKADADADLLVPHAGGIEPGGIRAGEVEPVGEGADATAPTRQIEIFEGAEIVEGPGGAPAERPEDVLAQPPDARDISAELAAPPRRRLPWLTLALSACIVAAAAFAGGALVEKSHLRSTPGGTGRAGTFAGGAGGAGGRTFGGFGAGGTRTGAGAGTGTGAGTGAAAGGAAGSGGAGGSGVTIGTVKLVDGDTLYVTDASGAIVKVTTGSSTKVTEAKAGKVADLQPGQSVTIRGSQSASGDIAATTVTEGAAAGGFAGFGGFGGGAAGGAGGGN
ncbi:hypothetical protein V2S66_32435 [Streptomyces sp. V4-01]|uniref:DUF5666 domain-containing protein n=1 Tax=Actinacidiphila polyblastidii TaxID=3110430 RepID=A0ABU7PLE5_9ACTN|nr:hypothetical protein [Streptomyces sp. V4-01]